MNKEIRYIASDGRAFENINNCKGHELQILMESNFNATNPALGLAIVKNYAAIKKIMEQ